MVPILVIVPFGEQEGDEHLLASFGNPRMLHIRPRDLTWTGWLVAILALGAGIVVGAPFAQWAFDWMGRSFFRTWKEPMAFVISIPAIAVTMLTFYVSSRVLQRAGIYVVHEERRAHRIAAQARRQAADRAARQQAKPGAERSP